MKQCSDCCQWVENEAKVCRHCRYRFTESDNQTSASERFYGKLIGIALAIGVFAYAVVQFTSDENLDRMAHAAAEADAR